MDRGRLSESYKKVIASKYGPKAIAYRRKRGYRHEDIEMCVGCLVMVDALVSGVIYSRDPGAEDSEVMCINATSGIARGVVDGTTATDLYLVGGEKPYTVVAANCARERAEAGETNQAAGGATLTYGQIKKLAETALQLENHFGRPQDIEWSYDHQGELYILQSRPIPVGRKTGQKDIPQIPSRRQCQTKPANHLFFSGASAPPAGLPAGKSSWSIRRWKCISFPKGSGAGLKTSSA